MINDQPRCTCFHIVCTRHEQYLTNICASDGRTYKSQCEIKRQQCIKQYEIVPIYPGVCHGRNDSLCICWIDFFHMIELGTDDDSFMDSDDDHRSDEELQTQTIDSSRKRLMH